MAGRLLGNPFLGAVVVLAVLLAGAVPAAYAELMRVGPVNSAPSVGGYPGWYQDTTGLALEYCDVLNQAEVDGGWCLLAPGDPPVVPEVFPNLFFDEHFWYAAEASMFTANGGKALLVLAVEAAFAGAVEPGGQIAFSRIRFKLTDVPVFGTYRFIHPYGEDQFTCPDECRGAAGDLIFVSDDVGVERPFDGALGSRLGPFLLPSNTPGGAELPAIPGPVPGKLYIAAPARLGPVTGSPLPNFIDSTGASRNHNIFRIEGPVGSNLGGPGVDFIETTDFSLMGRLFTGPIAGEATVDHAVYARSATAQKVDVYATAFPATQGRFPAGPPPAVVDPQLAFFDAPCTATLDENGNPGPPFSAPVDLLPNPMSVAGNHYFGQSHPTTALPLEVCIQMNALTGGGQPVLFFLPAPLRDQIFITEALYDPVGQSFSVKATSSDQVVPQTLTVVGQGDIDPTTGQLLVTSLLAPPMKVQVLSTAGGANELQVTTGAIANDAPVAVDDAAVTDEDVAKVINVVANDTDAQGNETIVPASVAIVTPPAHGAAVKNPDGTVTYTPAANYSGPDSFTYNVRDDRGSLSNTATVRVTVNSVNDPPVAVDDAATTDKNVPKTINVVGNDTDVDGTIDLTSVVIASDPANGGVVNNGNGTVTYTPAAGYFGPDSFTYTVQDNGGALSNTATVRVTVNDPPVAVDDAATADQGVSRVINVVANDTDADGNETIVPASVVIATGPASGGVVNNGNGTVTYTPNPGFSGVDTFTYNVKDNNNAVSNNATVTVTVNIPPVANDDPGASTNEDVPVPIDVLANDTDVDGNVNPATVAIVSGPAHGGAVPNVNGTVTYTPAANYSGPDSFTYNVRDDRGSLSNTATVTVTVNPVNDPPVANNDAATANLAPVTINVVGNDTDADDGINSTTVAIVPGSGPAHGGVLNNGNGTVTYTPIAGFSGPDSFTYNIRDNSGALSNIATVSLTVIGERITVTAAQYRRSTKSWIIAGTTTAPGPGNSMTIHIGSDLNGPILATVLVDRNGSWRFSQLNSPIVPLTNTISVISTHGATLLGAPLTVRD